jgi:hypothetical protein
MVSEFVTNVTVWIASLSLAMTEVEEAETMVDEIETMVEKTENSIPYSITMVIEFAKIVDAAKTWMED